MAAFHVSIEMLLK